MKETKVINIVVQDGEVYVNVPVQMTLEYAAQVLLQSRDSLLILAEKEAEGTVAENAPAN